MSKGSPIITIRIPQQLLLVMDTVIDRANQRRFDDDWTRSSFIVSAIHHKLNHMERSRRRKKKIPKAEDLVEPGEKMS